MSLLLSPSKPVAAHGATSRSGPMGRALRTAILAQDRCANLKHRLGAAADPELFRSLHTPIQLLDHALHRRTADRQPLATILRIVHPPLRVGYISHRLGRDFSRVRLLGIGCRFPQS